MPNLNSTIMGLFPEEESLKKTDSTHECIRSCFSRVQLFATPWTVALQVPLSMGFSRQEYWSGLPCPPPEDRPNPGIKPESSPSPALQVDSLPLSHQGSPQTQYSDTNMLAYQVPLSMGFSRQEYWSGLPFPSPGDLPGPGIEPGSPALQPEPPFEPLYHLSH